MVVTLGGYINSVKNPLGAHIGFPQPDGIQAVEEGPGAHQPGTLKSTGLGRNHTDRPENSVSCNGNKIV